MAKSQTLKTEIVESSPNSIIFKLQQEYTPRVIHYSKPVNSLVTLTLDDQGKIKYHKDMWNEKDYSHEGLGKVMKTLNGDQLTKVCVLICYGLARADIPRSRSHQKAYSVIHGSLTRHTQHFMPSISIQRTVTAWKSRGV